MITIMFKMLNNDHQIMFHEKNLETNSTIVCTNRKDGRQLNNDAAKC